jgi:hypothetical protein
MEYLHSVSLTWKTRSGLGRISSRQTKIGKFLLYILHKLLPDLVLQVVRLVIQPFLNAGITSDRRDVDHAVAEFDEGAAFDGEVEVGDVVQDPGRGHVSIGSLVLGRWEGG